MSSAIADIDHLLTYVLSLDAATRTYERLGFTLTPTSDIAPLGIANRLALMRPRTAGGASFIELMTVTDPAKVPPPMQPLLSGDEGVKSMVLLTPDAHAAHAHLVARGYAFAPQVRVKREWKLSASESVWPEFDVLLPIPAPLPFNACRYHNVEVYHRRAWTHHANTAEFVRTALAVANDAQATAGYYEQLFQVAARHEADGSVSIAPGHTGLRIYGPEAFANAFGQLLPPSPDGARYVGYEIEVRDVAICRRLLRQTGVAHSVLAAGLVVDPREAHGNLIIFAGARA